MADLKEVLKLLADRKPVWSGDPILSSFWASWDDGIRVTLSRGLDSYTIHVVDKSIEIYCKVAQKGSTGADYERLEKLFMKIKVAITTADQSRRKLAYEKFFGRK